MGAFRMVGAQWNFPHGDSLGGTSHCRVGEPRHDVCHRASFPQHLVPFSIRIILVFRGVGEHHDPVRLLVRSRDEERADWGGGAYLAQSLVLEAHCPGGGLDSWCYLDRCNWICRVHLNRSAFFLLLKNTIIHVLFFRVRLIVTINQARTCDLSGNNACCLQFSIGINSDHHRLYMYSAGIYSNLFSDYSRAWRNETIDHFQHLPRTVCSNIFIVQFVLCLKGAD